MAELPLPVPDEATAPFWEACRDGELRIQRCTGCAVFRHPPQPMCRQCGSSEYEWTAVSGRGSVFSYIVTHQPIHPALADLVPHLVVLVELEEGVRITSNVVECPPDEVAIGMPVEVTFERVNEEITLPKFRRV
ncbi:MAG TPA: OB-fold domain-containing protein [Dehalococcoidia bacterium]|nr:OB-fold domain-containing protein [Dehalococcoidia bacterium]